MNDDAHEESPAKKIPSFVSLGRSTRDRHPSNKYLVDEYVQLIDSGKTESYIEAMEYEHKKEWFYAMQDEMKSLYANNTFKLVKPPKGKRALKNRWVYRVKKDENTSQP